MIKVIAAAILNQEREILLCRKESLAYYIFPGGKPAIGEDMFTCLSRELKEELGCSISHATGFKFFDDNVSFIDKAPDGEDIEVHMFYVQCGPEPKPQAEIVELFWYRPGYKLTYPLTAMTTKVIDYLVKRGGFFEPL